MLRNKYALDLDYNFYLLNIDLEKYIFPEEEIKYILENKSAREREDNGKIILYDHKYLYLIPGETAERLKLTPGEKIELLRDISNIKRKDVTPENIKEISLLVHYSDYLLPAKEDDDVMAYEMPINLLYQKAPFYQKMFHLTEEAQFRKDDIKRSGKKITREISSGGQEEKLTLSKEAKEYLAENNEASRKKEPDWKEDYQKLQQFKNNFTKSRNYQSGGLTENKKDINIQSNPEETGKAEKTNTEKVIDQDRGNKLYNYQDIKEIFGLTTLPPETKGQYKISGQIEDNIQKNNSKILNAEVNPSSEGIIGSNRKIDYLIQDNHPEKILGSGTGNIGKYTIPGGDSQSPPKNNLLTSYHENRISDTEDNDRSIVYNFTAKENGTEITFHRANFSVDQTGVKAGALAAGENFKDGYLPGIDNGYIKNAEGKVINIKEELERLKKTGNTEGLKELQDKFTQTGEGITIKLDAGETFSFQAPTPLKNEHDVFASAIEFQNNKEIDIEINFVKDTGTSPTDKESNAYQEWFKPSSALKDERGYFKLTQDKIDTLPENIQEKFTKIPKEGTREQKEILNQLLKEILPNEKSSEKKLKDKLKDLGFDNTKKLKDLTEVETILEYIKVTNYRKTEGEPDGQEEAKQVSGVFPNPNYDITGTVIPANKHNNDNSTIIILPPPEITKNDTDKPFTCKPPLDINTEKYCSTGTDEKGNEIINDGAFSQNFHYKLEISDYNEKSKYQVVVIPGGDVISSHNQSNPQIAKPNDINKTAITLPSKIKEENGKYYIEFDYFVEGGSGNPAYASVVENSRRGELINDETINRI